MTTENIKPTQKELFSRFVALFHEQATIAQDIKALNDEYKELYPEADLGNIKAVAKAVSEQKLGDKLDKNKQFEETANTFAN